MYTFGFFNSFKNSMNLTDGEIRTLQNLGYTDNEIKNMSQDEINKIFAPGTLLDGSNPYMSFTDNQTKELLATGIAEEDLMILSNLGYSFNDILTISDSELDFVIPNTELLANLQKHGLTEEMINQQLSQGKTYRDIIKGVLKQ